MNKITIRQAASAVFGAVVSQLDDAAARMQAPTAETLGKFLSMDPATAKPAIPNGLPATSWEIPVTFNGRETMAAERALHLMAMMLSARLDRSAIVERRYGTSANVTQITMVNKQGGVHILTETERPSCAIIFDPPRDALKFTALVNARTMLAILEDCARYQEKEQHEAVSPLTKFILTHLEALRACLHPEAWFLSNAQHTEMLSGLDEMRAHPELRDKVRRFRGGYPYPMVNGLLNREGKFEVRPICHKEYAVNQSSLPYTWMAMCACEPVAFLHALITLHAPLFDNDTYLNDDVLFVDNIATPTEQRSSFDYAVELTPDGIDGW